MGSKQGTGLERGMALVAVLFFTASLEFCCALWGTGPALAGALLLGAGAIFLWNHFDLPQGRVWLPVLALAGVILASVTIVQFTFSRHILQWLAPLLAAAAASVVIALRRQGQSRCNLCNRRLKLQAVTFRCPRCSMLVCDESCWSFEHRRCAMCLENRVPILQTGDSWWNRVTGPRALQGRCQVCLATGEQQDLRACPRCRRLQCRDCWDFHNGDCTRCGESLPDLPQELHSVVAETNR